MEEILELQKKLAEAQEISNVNKITDRVVVEIVEKIIKKLNLKLVFTRDGQEYVTPDYIEKQIYDLIQQKGCVNVQELPDLLNIS